MSDELKHAIRRKSGFWQTMRAVFWAFFGVRKRGDYEKDTEQLNPIYVIVGGLLGAALFVAVLILIVQAVVK